LELGANADEPRLGAAFEYLVSKAGVNVQPTLLPTGLRKTLHCTVPLSAVMWSLFATWLKHLEQTLKQQMHVETPLYIVLAIHRCAWLGTIGHVKGVLTKSRGGGLFATL
jgi:hypothetical protein